MEVVDVQLDKPKRKWKSASNGKTIKGNYFGGVFHVHKRDDLTIDERDAIHLNITKPEIAEWVSSTYGSYSSLIVFIEKGKEGYWHAHYALKTTK